MTDFSRWRAGYRSGVERFITRMEAGARRWIASPEDLATLSARELAAKERQALKAEIRHKQEVAARLAEACSRYGGAVFPDRDVW